jgi:thiamine-phosphate pyrophosphorylase
MAKLRGLYAITPELADGDELLRRAEAALRGGARLFQLRMKGAAAARQVAFALKKLTDRHGARLIINDDVELALEVDAHGAHLGRDDGDLRSARAKLRGKILGASCYDSLAAARAAVAAGADYVAFGSVFASPTKPAAVRAPLSLFGNDLGVPLCAIGGITLENAPSLIAAGADCLAVISDLFDAPDIAARAAAYERLFTHEAA